MALSTPAGRCMTTQQQLLLTLWLRAHLQQQQQQQQQRMLTKQAHPANAPAREGRCCRLLRMPALQQPHRRQLQSGRSQTLCFQPLTAPQLRQQQQVTAHRTQQQAQTSSSRRRQRRILQRKQHLHLAKANLPGQTASRN
jgi:hypothetical protein